MSDLKPCPFCGGEIGFDFEHDNFLCSGCWAIMPYSPNGETVNTRPIEDKLKAEIDRLKLVTDKFYLLLVDNTDTKLLADAILCEVYGIETPEEK